MTRKQLLKSKGYWITQFQIKVHETIMDYMTKHSISIDQFCKRKGFSKDKIKQVVKGDWEGSIEEYVMLIMACGEVPIIHIEKLKDQK